MGETDRNPLIDEIAETLLEEGFKVDRDVGQSHFRCDLAVYREGDPQYRLGILTDNSTWYSQEDLLERELMKPPVVARIWMADYGCAGTRLVSRP